MQWIKCSDRLPPKDTKFLYSYHCGIGLGQWGECYTVIRGNSERTHHAYILILHPCEILDGNDPWSCDEKTMIEMEMSWMPLPEVPNVD
jgi:Protein of unknown function (DUF551)